MLVMLGAWQSNGENTRSCQLLWDALALSERVWIQYHWSLTIISYLHHWWKLRREAGHEHSFSTWRARRDLGETSVHHTPVQGTSLHHLHGNCWTPQGSCARVRQVIGVKGARAWRGARFLKSDRWRLIHSFSLWEQANLDLGLLLLGVLICSHANEWIPF